MRSFRLAAVVLSVVGCWSSAALAEETKKPAARPVIVTPDVDVFGKHQIPMAVDVARVTFKLKLAELRQPLVDRIGKAVDRSPF